ncbi:MAG: M15 family metallopeptidase [Microcystaceae cyanobacterium]
MKPYQAIPIQDCGEPLIPIPLEKFAVETPHPYEKLGADYQGKSPYYLRQTVVESLIQAQNYLDHLKPQWRIKIFDGFRPLQIQQFMVDYSFEQLVNSRKINLSQLSVQQIESLWQEVYTIWAIPNDNPETPPPHSTGAAIDITLVDHQGNTIDMGGEIDELSERSQPNYYEKDSSLDGQTYHKNRALLDKVMKKVGFRRHLGEWWHFSLGDQMWVWLGLQGAAEMVKVARYGRFDQ